ncbi:tyrosine--tRNA ligase [Candidatus Pantoea edessiphila]|uniref:Tyrosine--tRNA ligase n=1 Tax=Candidatus Pantoea edessiphila TaxID=2044610 RepID=A0A2P5SYR9_9GAMM|nr:tyrosine--tRNA ligase [Candidatus Pantoea edessiphila]MBK4775395.1 tyrosine--tRNA ligase [Pantoea sp. Edef]PPI87475.1 tyrosine--tRNA ligase [Candidatus Pantoea edessiphila]
MIKNNILEYLYSRNLIFQLTNRELLEKKLKKGPISVYCGFDPTAESLHLGHLIPIICLKYFQDRGHKPIVLLGGATGLIGDPSFKAKERKLQDNKTVIKCVEKIKTQITKLLNFDCGCNSAVIVDNNDWFSEISLLSFLRDIGKHFSVNQMINKEAIKQRLNRSDQGISYTEFSYNLLQSYDFAYLNRVYDVSLQIGGSDQWGNITSGINLTHRLNNCQVFGITVPLITKSDGTKFGKTENETIWLDSLKTSPYKFYQFWINTSDNDVYRFLRYFTSLHNSEIDSLEHEDKNTNKTPRAQYILAEQITRLVHGENGLISAKRITDNLFSSNIVDMTESDFKQLAFDGITTIVVDKCEDLQKALVQAKLVSSLSQARTMINNSAIYVNGTKQSNVNYKFNKHDKLFNKYTLVRRGKKNYCLINWI